MLQDQRVISHATDISVAVNDFRTGTAAFVYTSGQYLYIGAPMPFNNLWFEVGTANVNAATPTIQQWFGNAWVSAVDVSDETAGLTASGRMSWNTDRLKGWDFEQTSETVTGLESFKIYWKYWLRISFSATFSVGTTLKYIGQKFSNDTILPSYYPDLMQAEVLSGFATGKTTWDEQHYMAAEAIVADLKARNIIFERGQLLDWSIFTPAACHKVAEIAYTAFGSPYLEQLKLARANYKDALNIKFFKADKNLNGSLDPAEKAFTTAFGGR